MDGDEVNPHELGYCCRFATGQSCIGCGDEVNGVELMTLDFAMMIRRLHRKLSLVRPNDPILSQSIKLLEKYGIKSSPLRGQQ